MDGAVKMIGAELACRWMDSSVGIANPTPPLVPAGAAGALPMREGAAQPGHSRVSPTGPCFGRTVHPGSPGLTNIWENVGS